MTVLLLALPLVHQSRYRNKIMYHEPIRNPLYPHGPKYYLRGWTYYSTRYKKSITIPSNHPSDGATGAFDIRSNAWQVHDVVCAMQFPEWDSGEKIYPWTAAYILGDILHQEGYHIRDRIWPIMTFVFGCRSTWRNL